MPLQGRLAAAGRSSGKKQGDAEDSRSFREKGSGIGIESSHYALSFVRKSLLPIGSPSGIVFEKGFASSHADAEPPRRGRCAGRQSTQEATDKAPILEITPPPLPLTQTLDDKDRRHPLIERKRKKPFRGKKLAP